MRLTVDDTIAALASPPGASARGVIRVSGPGTRAILRRVFRPRDVQKWQAARVAQRFTGTVACRLLEDVRVPAAVYLWPTSRSFTGQPAAELHLWGAPVLLQAVLEALYARGARPAQPGEFTLRAFLAGRIDLVQAEAVLGVIDANEQEQLQTALSQLAGGLSSELAAVRSDLLELLADIEAGLDFVEEDIEFVSAADIQRRLRDADTRLARLLDRARERLDYRGHFRVVIAGLANAGKSTLFNALLGESAALVSDREGTTTDYLTARVEWDGVPIELVDTAGWEDLPGGPSGNAMASNDTPAAAASTSAVVTGGRAAVRVHAAERVREDSPSTSDRDAWTGMAAADSVVVKSLARQRRDQQVGRADLILWCAPCDADDAARADDRAAFERAGCTDAQVIQVGTKSDLRPTSLGADGTANAAAVSTGGRNWGAHAAGETRGSPSSVSDAPRNRSIDAPDVFVACRGEHSEGLEQLKACVLDRLVRCDGGRGEIVGTTAARSRESLRAAREALARALAQAAADGTEDTCGQFDGVGAAAELLAIEIRAALDELGRILGIVYTDDILDRIFSKFCIGK